MNIVSHKARKPLLILSVILTIVVLVVLIYFCKIALNNLEMKESIIEIMDDEDWFINIVGNLGAFGAVICLIIFIIRTLLIIYNSRITAMAYDIEVTNKQFKELIDFEEECAKKLGLKEVPKLFIDVNGDSEIRINNAKFENKHILRIDASEIYNTTEENYYVAKFTIARKLVAIYLGYYDLVYNIITMYSNWIPILNQLNLRVICYDCDKGAVALVGKDLAIKSLILTSTGFYITPYINQEEYLRSLENVLNDKYVIYENLMLENPLVAYRMEAIMKNIDGRLF